MNKLAKRKENIEPISFVPATDFNHIMEVQEVKTSGDKILSFINELVDPEYIQKNYRYYSTPYNNISYSKIRYAVNNVLTIFILNIIDAITINFGKHPGYTKEILSVLFNKDVLNDYFIANEIIYDTDSTSEKTIFRIFKKSMDFSLTIHNKLNELLYGNFILDINNFNEDQKIIDDILYDQIQLLVNNLCGISLSSSKDMAYKIPEPKNYIEEDDYSF